jgi:hypothetical protein
VLRVDLVARGRVDPAGRVTVADQGDMNRVVAATAGTAAVMAPADLASRAVPVVRVGMILAVPVGPVDMILAVPVGLVVRVGMILAVPVGPVDMILVDPEGRQRAPNPVVRVDPERLVVPNPVARVGPGNREATDLSLGRALLGRMPMRRVRMPMGLHLTAARPPLMPALLHLTPAARRTRVDRRRDPTTRAVATCQEATPAEATLRAEATPAVAVRRAETRRALRTCRKSIAVAPNSRAVNGFSIACAGYTTRHEESRTLCRSNSRNGRRSRTGRFGCRDGGSSSARPVPAVVSR